MDTESQYIFDRMQLHRLLEKHPDWTDEKLAEETGRCKRWVRKWRPRVLNPEVKDFSRYLSLSRAPKTIQKKVHPDVEKLIVDLREELSEVYHRKAGPIVIINELRKREDLKDEGYYLPTSPTTIADILKKNGYILPKRPRFRIPIVLPEPNEEWEIDFGIIYLGDKSRFEFFVVVDRGTSRVIYLEGCERYHAETALAAVAKLFILHGLPKRIRMDRDSRFVGAWTADSYPSALLRFIRNVGVEPVICPPRRPDKKPFVERAIFTIKHEWFARLSLDTIADAHEALESFPHYYHSERIHQGQACQNKTPDEAFPNLPPLPSIPEQIDPDAWLNLSHGRVYRRRISSNGTIQIDKFTYYVDKNYAKQSVLVHLDAQKKTFSVENGSEIIKVLDIKGLHGEKLIDLQSYIRQMKEEARSTEMHRLMMWYKIGDAA